MSKIKKRIIIKKNCMEKFLWEGTWELKPHSNLLHFSSVGSNNKTTNLIIKSITVTKSPLIKNVSKTIIFKN